MELDPHYCCQPGGDSRYCGDQHGSGVGSGYYALRQGEWKLLVGDPAGGTQHEITMVRLCSLRSEDLKGWDAGRARRWLVL